MTTVVVRNSIWELLNVATVLRDFLLSCISVTSHYGKQSPFIQQYFVHLRSASIKTIVNVYFKCHVISPGLLLCKYRFSENAGSLTVKQLLPS